MLLTNNHTAIYGGAINIDSSNINVYNHKIDIQYSNRTPLFLLENITQIRSTVNATYLIKQHCWTFTELSFTIILLS